MSENDANEPLNPANGSAEAEIINAAYGLVQGVYGLGDMMSNVGHREWNKTHVQDEAMKAARSFVVALRIKAAGGE